jgi:thymidylate synthase ThyX
VPPEVHDAGSDSEARYRATLDGAFETYARWLEPLQAWLRERIPRDPADSELVYRSTIRAKACDALRGLLPAATVSNVGMFATAQSYEQLLLRMRGHPLREVREYSDLILVELRKVIPAFLTRVDRPDRGGAWTDYLRWTRDATADVAQALLDDQAAEPRDEVTLTDFDPDGETKVVAAALYASSSLPDDQLLDLARRMSPAERAGILAAYVGDRANRRHRPGRAFERTSYRFDVVCDYGAFRDLQRHRLLTVEWQSLSPSLGYVVPVEIAAAGAVDDWHRVMAESSELFEALRVEAGPSVAPYAVAMAHRIRFVMQMNAREAMHLIELRSMPQGHPAYRRVAQRMHELIASGAGHAALAAAMRFADHSAGDEGRLEAERQTEARRAAPPRAG